MYHGIDTFGLAGSWLSDALNTNNHTFEVAPVFIVVEKALLRLAFVTSHHTICTYSLIDHTKGTLSLIDCVGTDSLIDCNIPRYNLIAFTTHGYGFIDSTNAFCGLVSIQ